MMISFVKTKNSYGEVNSFPKKLQNNLSGGGIIIFKRRI